MLKRSTSWVIFIYGIALICLGYLGYTEGSRISFYMGGGFGAALVLSSILVYARIALGSYLAIFLTVALTAVFGVRYSLTHKELPAILAVLSGSMLLFLLAQTAKWRK